MKFDLDSISPPNPSFFSYSFLPFSYFHFYPSNTYVTLYATESSVKSIFPLSGVRRLFPNPEFALKSRI